MLDRRAFLKAGGVALFGLGAGPTFLQRTAWAAPEPTSFGRRKVLVTIFQRGAMDGLMAVSPLNDGNLAKLRPSLSISASRGKGHDEADAKLLDLGVDFALHPAFAELMPWWQEQQLGIVHATGSPDPTRSHFDAQDFMETGTPGRKGTADGWLNRVVGHLGHDATPFRAVSMTAAMPRSLYGDQPALAVTNLRDFRVDLPGTTGAAQAAGQGFEALYEQTSQDLLRDTAADTFEAVDMLDKLRLDSYRPAAGADYPRSPLASSLQQIALLIKSDVGLQVAFAESGGWDTHVRQGTVRGSFASRASDLSRSISAFWQDLGNYRDDVLLMTMTEFGRTVAENGTGGTDHGHGSCMFLLGTDLDGGKVHGDFPSLDRDALYDQRDLPVTTDFRSVFTAAAAGHLGFTASADLFPGWSGRPLPILRSS